MLRIAVCYDKFGSSRSGGGRRSLLSLLEELSNYFSIKVDAYQSAKVDDLPNLSLDYDIHHTNIIDVPKFAWMNQIVRRYQWRRYIEEEINDSTDLIVTQNDLAPASIKIANSKGIPSVFLTSSMAMTGYEKYNPSNGHLANFYNTDMGGRLQYPFLWKNFYDYGEAMRNSSQTRASSDFAATKIDDLFGANSKVIYPPIELDKYRVQRDKSGYITMANPRAEYKGGDIFLNIAQQLSEEEFLLVGPISSHEIKQNAEKLPNVTHWDWCDDMREAYSVSKLVVTPSRVEETFGRVPAEAMVSGIPCVVSNRGGLPEVVGDTGQIVNDIESIECWISAIEAAFKHHSPNEQIERAKQFSSTLQGKRFKEMVESALRSET